MTRLDASAQLALARATGDQVPPIKACALQKARQDYLDSFTRAQLPLQDVASAFATLAGHDVLFNEGAAYAARLASESLATQQIWPGQIHGFVSTGLVVPQAR
jgi:acetyl esterase/lipase